MQKFSRLSQKTFFSHFRALCEHFLVQVRRPFHFQKKASSRSFLEVGAGLSKTSFSSFPKVKWVTNLLAKVLTEASKVRKKSFLGQNQKCIFFSDRAKKLFFLTLELPVSTFEFNSEGLSTFCFRERGLFDKFDLPLHHLF